ncbi:hypothetical protein CPB84DRAFT_1800775 [Gymnopilus junonius]|uniref:Uncharacterized protein n=1 Tax=Gymnopilus junonius TaxID=109634 RepID=A0A9P5TET0_GYMJU|nr:hypothetical protein CPB84DRAFT_1800775 [Gymnopilus junonius]
MTLSGYGSITWQETRDVIHSLQSKLFTSGILPRGTTDLDHTVLFNYEASKGKHILGIKYRSREDMFTDMLADFEARGWLERPFK